MKIDSVNDLTVFVGKNDVGKSTVLEALDLFFNDGKGVIKYDGADISVDKADNEFVIGVTFRDLPERVIVDAAFQTTLTDEFLLNKDGKLEVMKKYNESKCTSVLLKAFHPTNPQCADLHLKKRNELMICHVSLENIFLTFIRSQARTKWGGFCKIFCVRNRKNCTVLV